jgi:hypothetical protein
LFELKKKGGLQSGFMAVSAGDERCAWRLRAHKGGAGQVQRTRQSDGRLEGLPRGQSAAERKEDADSTLHALAGVLTAFRLLFGHSYFRLYIVEHIH